MLLGEDAVATVVGALDGVPVSAAGGSGGKRCTWTGADGGSLTIETADPETFDALREAAYEPQDVPGLGSGAYWSQTGANGKLVVHGGAVVLLIEASKGRELAEKRGSGDARRARGGVASRPPLDAGKGDDRCTGRSHGSG